MAIDSCRRLVCSSQDKHTKSQQALCRGTPYLEEISSHQVDPSSMGFSSLPHHFLLVTSSWTILCYSPSLLICFFLFNTLFCVSFTSSLNISKNMDHSNSKSRSDRRKSISAKGRYIPKACTEVPNISSVLRQSKQTMSYQLRKPILSPSKCRTQPTGRG